MALQPGLANRLLLAALALALALAVYGPALRGPFLSDDLHYVEQNAYLHELTPANLWEILSPSGAAARNVVNWSPVQLLLHAAVWQLCAEDTLGHHLLNLLLHTGASLLLLPLFARMGIPRALALFGAGAFLLHPANVEAVAWISQLKSSSALLLSLAALLLQPRRPGAAAGVFLLALLAKPNAAFALPVGALLLASEGRPQPWRWHALCALGFAAFALVEFGVHQRSGAAPAELHAEPFLLLRSVLALLARYAWMAATSLGVSAFHEPEPARSLADPWWLAALLLVGGIGWRCAALLRRPGRVSPELACWAWAAISFAPVSQIFPFLYPMADRYLYFILPGLLGAALLAGREGSERAARRWPWIAGAAAPRGLLAVAALGLLLAFSVRAHARARIWRSPVWLMADAAAHYPDGVAGQLQRAKRAAQEGDIDGVVRGIRAAIGRGYNRFEQLQEDPAWAPVARHPRFQALVHEVAASRIRWFESQASLTQLEWRGLAAAHLARRERREALAALERALATGGAQDELVRQEIEGLRRFVD